MPKTETICTQLRINSDLFAKSKILAAVYGESFNAFVVRLMSSAVTQYEDAHGVLPTPLSAEAEPFRSPTDRSQQPRA